MRSQKVYHINRPLKEVLPYFENIEQFLNLHPLIISSKILENNAEGNQVFEIFEKPFSWLPIKIKYEATVIKQNNGVMYDIQKIPLNHPQLSYSIKPVGAEKTQITFTIYIQGIWLVSNYLAFKMTMAMDAIVGKIRT